MCAVGMLDWAAAVCALVVTMPQLASATDQAIWAARAALAVKKHWPLAGVSLSTGRGKL